MYVYLYMYIFPLVARINHNIGSFSFKFSEIFVVTESFLEVTIGELRYTRSEKRASKRSQKASKSLVCFSRETASLDDFESKLLLARDNKSPVEELKRTGVSGVSWRAHTVLRRRYGGSLQMSFTAPVHECLHALFVARGAVFFSARHWLDTNVLC